MHNGVSDVVNSVNSVNLVTAEARRSIVSRRRDLIPFRSRTRRRSCRTDFWWEGNI
jgi:hypothetical protein